MVSENEYYYKNELMVRMESFIDEELEDHDFGLLPDNLSRLMAEAVYNVLATVKDVNNYMSKEGLLK